MGWKPTDSDQAFATGVVPMGFVPRRPVVPIGTVMQIKANAIPYRLSQIDFRGPRRCAAPERDDDTVREIATASAEHPPNQR